MHDNAGHHPVGLEAPRPADPLLFFRDETKGQTGQAIFSNAVLFLDEPCTNLDTEGIGLYRQLIAEYAADRLIVVSSNDRQNMIFVRRPFLSWITSNRSICLSLAGDQQVQIGILQIKTLTEMEIGQGALEQVYTLRSGSYAIQVLETSFFPRLQQ